MELFPVRAALLAMVVGLLCASEAAAQGDVRLFSISAGDADVAIATFARQAHRQILAPGEALVGLKTPDVHGQFDSTAALSMLLKGTGLWVSFDDGQTIILKRRTERSEPERQGVFAPNDDKPPEAITVTGYRASLADAATWKRTAVGFTDTVFAEDIGKFPDTNIAEALNRIPGVTISREIDGEGVNVSIRGLGTNFTKIVLNGAQATVATTGATDARNNNREVDLNMFPTELFTKLEVSKTPVASQMEGGAAGTVTMRSMRPFDNPGLHFTYNMQGTKQSLDPAYGKRGTLIVSDTEGPFGLLIGISGVQNPNFVKGYEDGNAGWNTPTLASGQCGTGNTCTQFGGNSWTIPATVPGNVRIPIPTGYTLASGWTAAAGNTLPNNYPIDAGLLYALNPGLGSTQNQAITRLSNALLPRLGRPMFSEGTRDRYNAVISAEYRPTDSLHFYTDFIFGRQFNDLNRSDLFWGVRSGNGSQNNIPVGLVLDPRSLADSNTGGLAGVVGGNEHKPAADTGIGNAEQGVGRHIDPDHLHGRKRPRQRIVSCQQFRHLT